MKLYQTKNEKARVKQSTDGAMSRPSDCVTSPFEANSERKAKALADARASDEPLVIKFISHVEKDLKQSSPSSVKSFLVYPRAVKLFRDYKSELNKKNISPRSEITSFSASSRKRLKFTSANAFPQLISQFGMTYHKSVPDGQTIKRHLNLFLNELRKNYPESKYLWILEFQSRGIPHFHTFLNLPYNYPGLAQFLAETWHRIAEPDSKQHFNFHSYKGQSGWEKEIGIPVKLRTKKFPNFTPWDMGSGSYLCKYLDKEAQKCVPSGFTGVGRFWGNSRGLVPEPEEVETAIIDEIYPNASKSLVRTLCKHHEKSLSGSPWQSSARKRPTSYTLPNGATIFHRLLESLGNT